MEYVVRLLISAGLIVAVAEVGKGSPRLGGLLASLPLVSYVGLLWLYADTRDPARAAQKVELRARARDRNTPDVRQLRRHAVAPATVQLSTPSPTDADFD